MLRALVSLVFSAVFVIGCFLAGLGGALGAEILGLDPIFPLRFKSGTGGSGSYFQFVLPEALSPDAAAVTI